MRKPLLFLPGPMQVPDQVRAAGDRPLFNHRSPQMVELLSRLQAGCRPLFGTTGDIIFLASSGSGAMESAVVNLTSQGDEIIVVVGGSQKGLMVSPGLGVVAIGPRAWEKAEHTTSPRFYFDWKKLKSTVPFTPALSLLLELDGSLDFIHAQGLDRIFARRAQVA